MSQAIQIFNHPEFGGVRVVGNAENPRFCLSDVCKILAIGNPSDVKKRLGDGVVSIEVISDALGRSQNVTFINEDGLYDVILDSRKPEAKRFRKWVTSEVLPSIRKGGFYATEAKVDEIVRNPDRFIEELMTAYKRVKTERDAALLQAAELKPKADYCERILQSPEALNVTVIAKDYGMGGAMFNQLLYSLKIQYPVGRTWVLYQDYVGKGYTVTETVVTKNGGSATQMKWTQRGRMFLYNELKKHGKLPLCEQESPMATLFGATA
ncbi:MAG: phage antirepressor KilAC domain-containing protein [Selenomonadaceae bacterium]|nr:phage antirepressor KilAC domain-containing protein [Selenomonadaceae bacterium]